jgi:hypothetical protein
MANIYFCMYGSFAWCVLPIPVNSSLVKLLLGYRMQLKFGYSIVSEDGSV